MDLTTLLIIVVVVLLLGGGGWYGPRALVLRRQGQAPSQRHF